MSVGKEMAMSAIKRFARARTTVLTPALMFFGASAAGFQSMAGSFFAEDALGFRNTWKKLQESAASFSGVIIPTP
jgi:hypothetical protein